MTGAQLAYPAERLIPRNKGLSLSAELHLIGTVVAWEHVERLPHHPTPQVAQRIEKEAAPSGLFSYLVSRTL